MSNAGFYNLPLRPRRSVGTIAMQKFWRILAQGLVGTLVAGVLLAILGYVISNNRELGELRVQGNKLEGRVDRLADALPGIGVRVAYEGLLDPFSVAVLVGVPFEDGGKWYSKSLLLDSSVGTKTRYKVVLDSAFDFSPYHEAFGHLYSKTSFIVTPMTKVEDWSNELYKSFYWPPDLLKEVSFVSRADAKYIKAAFNDAGFVKLSSEPAKFGKSWEELEKRLREDPSFYKSTMP